MDQIFKRELTADGSWTYYSTEYQELFHSHQGAKQEAEEKFIKPCHIPELAEKQSCICLLDVCYGLGYNSAAALETIWSVNPNCRVELIALEIDPNVPSQAIRDNLLGVWSDQVINCLNKLSEQQCCRTDLLAAKLLIGDARKTLSQLSSSQFLADGIFLDPFSPPKCPQLWTVEFLNLLASHLKPQGRLATYSCAASVRNALQLAGLHFGPTPGVGRRSPGTVASFSLTSIPPLSQQEREHLQTRAAIPYRDPRLEDSPEEIKARRIIEQNCSSLEPSSRWKKRWLSQGKSINNSV